MPVTLEKMPGHDDRVILSMGPQHPSTHGVLRMVLELEGETVIRAIYDIGYLHTGFEKSFEEQDLLPGHHLSPTGWIISRRFPTTWDSAWRRKNC